jgi:hypothetical protein
VILDDDPLNVVQDPRCASEHVEFEPLTVDLEQTNRDVWEDVVEPPRRDDDGIVVSTAIHRGRVRATRCASERIGPVGADRDLRGLAGDHSVASQVGFEEPKRAGIRLEGVDGSARVADGYRNGEVADAPADVDDDALPFTERPDAVDVVEQRLL